ncbi:MAG: hypothetical protein ACOYKJ_07865 [Candidatus Howiella sp.]|jgi:hypothetical protein
MRKALSILVAAVIAFSMFTFNAGATITDINTVGAVAGDVSLAPGFTNDKATLALVRKLIIQEYNRGVLTRSIKHKGTAYFDYGESTGELVHPWVGSDRKVEETGEVIPAASCMNQDFTGGYSDSLATLGQGNNWCCILVTPESLALGKAYTVRDGIANAWGNAGGTNSYWGLPTGNQYWIGDTCYQTFERGYASALKGQVINVEFLAYDAGNVAPAPGDYDHYTEKPITDDKLPETKPDDVNPDDGNIVPYDPQETTNPGDETQDGESQEGETQEGESQEGEVTSTEGEGADEAEVNSNTGKTSSKAGGTVTTTTYFLGMELTPELQRNLIIGGIALAVLIIAIIVVIIVLVKKKKAKAAAEVPAEDAPVEDAPADEEPKDEENK